MARQMTDTASGGLLRQQPQLPLYEQSRYGRNFTYRSDGSGPSESRRAAGFRMMPQLKDEAYWRMRLKNNESARRSREKKRLNEIEFMRKMTELSNENFTLRAQLTAIEQQFGVRGDVAIAAQLQMIPTDGQTWQRTTAQQSTPWAAAAYPQARVGGSTSGAHAAVTDGHPGRGISTDQHWLRHQYHLQQQQWLQRQRREVAAAAAAAAHWPYDDSGAIRGPSSTAAAGAAYVPRASADGALDLSRGVAAEPSAPTRAPPVIWRAFETTTTTTTGSTGGTVYGLGPKSE